MNKTEKILFCDLDGVLFDPSKRLKYLKGKLKSWDKFYSDEKIMKDKPIEAGITLVKSLAMVGYKVVYVTSRREMCLEASLKQIACAGLPLSGIIMRKTGDVRKAWLVKASNMRKMLWGYGKPVEGYFLDDDPRNCYWIGKKFKNIKPLCFGIGRYKEK